MTIKECSQTPVFLPSVRSRWKMVLKELASSALSCLPLKAELLKKGALAPPQYRTSLSYKFFTALATRTQNLPDEFETNLGIAAPLRVRIGSRKIEWIFGAPRFWVSERSSLDLALVLFRDSDCFVDIGSNAGIFLFYLHCNDCSGKPMYYFEPDPSLFVNLEQNLARNNIKTIRGFPFAVAERSGSLTFYKNQTDNFSGTIVKEDWSMHELLPIEVRSISFGDSISENTLGNACVKVDVEGAEERFWEGAKDHFSYVKYMIIEILGPSARRGFAARIAKSGFNLYYINDYDLEYSRNGEFRYKNPFCNFLVSRESPAALARKLSGAGFRVLEQQDSGRSCAEKGRTPQSLFDPDKRGARYRESGFTSLAAGSGMT